MTDLFGPSITSIALFVAIGLLIGHLLWYRDTSADRKKLRESEYRHVKIRAAVRQRKQQLAQLQTQLIARDAEVASKVSKQQQLVDHSRALQATIEEFRVVSADFEQDREATAAKHREELKRSELLKNQLQEVLKKNTDLENRLLATTEKQGDRDEEIQRLSESSKQVSSQRDQLQAANKQVQDALAARIKDLSQRDSQINELKSQLAESAQQITDQQARFEALSSNITEKQSRLGELGKQVEGLLPLRQQLASKEESLEKATLKVEQLLQANHRHLAEIETLSNQNCQSKEQLSELASLQEVVTVKQTELVQLQQRLATSDSRCKVMEETNAKQKSKFEQELTQAKQTIVDQRQSIESRTKQTETLTKQFETDKAQLVESNQQHAAINQQLEQRVKTFGEEHRLLIETRDQFKLNLSKASKTIGQEQATIVNLRKEIESRQREVSEITHQLESATKEKAEIQSRVDDQIQAIERLQTQLKTAEKLGPVNSSLNDRVAELMEHIDHINHELEDSLDTNVKAGNRIRDLETQLQEHSEKIRDLRRTRAAAPVSSITEQPVNRAA